MLDYDMPLYRPPSEGNNLIIQATLGCSFNQCSFCSMYKDKTYRPRPLQDVFADIDRAAYRWPEAARVFLADGDALALPTGQLLSILQYLDKTFPRLSRVSSYATPANIRRKTIGELELLRRHRLTLLYFGIESGSDLILKKITKGATHRTISDSMQKSRDAGMKLSSTVVLGLGGSKYWQAHIDGTTALLNLAPTTYLSTLQLYLESNVQQEFARKFGEPFSMQDDRGILSEQQRLIANLNPPSPVIFRSNHASNALALAGNLPKERARLLAEIDQVQRGERGVRPSFLRGL
ncbi:MAG: radical SAM protein [Chromatiaceae bacterium]|nr:radical SAM protein [Gammaproteobacteria bacterium]MCP5426777.1 radical SAM protein [Chromatiaceae bacterium]MCB1860863.1 radical SAM protein [Gammaproteobacteria bacterium]MCB1870882.1 radical SAM protein [Gammaproteobacteria bacterium]MCB1879424.1 radical SAM protein [Gammaproteobacteria bacterium]